VVWRSCGYAASACLRSACWHCLCAGFGRATQQLSGSLHAPHWSNRGRRRRRAGVVWIEQFFKYDAVGNGGIGGDDFAYELVALVDVGVKLVVEVVLAMLLRPLGVDIFLRAFMSLPGDGHRAFLDRLRLFALVALDRCLNKRRIDDLATACHLTMRQQLLLHLIEQLGARPA